MEKNIYPVGTVVLLKGSTKRVMIIGFYQKTIDDPNKVWDYAGCIFPEGYVGRDKVFVFDHEQIEKVFMVGYQDEEQIAFRQRINEVINSMM